MQKTDRILSPARLNILRYVPDSFYNSVYNSLFDPAVNSAYASATGSAAASAAGSTGSSDVQCAHLVASIGISDLQ